MSVQFSRARWTIKWINGSHFSYLCIALVTIISYVNHLYACKHWSLSAAYIIICNVHRKNSHSIIIKNCDWQTYLIEQGNHLYMQDSMNNLHLINRFIFQVSFLPTKALSKYPTYLKYSYSELSCVNRYLHIKKRRPIPFFTCVW